MRNAQLVVGIAARLHIIGAIVDFGLPVAAGVTISFARRLRSILFATIGLAALYLW